VAEICESCKWFVEDPVRKLDGGEKIGWCRRYPPTSQKRMKVVGHDNRGPIEQEVEETAYPVVQFNWHCGEYRAQQGPIRPSALTSFHPAKPADPAPAVQQEIAEKIEVAKAGMPKVKIQAIGKVINPGEPGYVSPQK
jgi:hypothetical protein